MACLVSVPWLLVGGLVGPEDDMPACSCARNGDLGEYEKKNGVVSYFRVYVRCKFVATLKGRRATDVYKAVTFAIGSRHQTAPASRCSLSSRIASVVNKHCLEFLPPPLFHPQHTSATTMDNAPVAIKMEAELLDAKPPCIKVETDADEMEDGEIAPQSTVRSMVAYSSSPVADEPTTISHVSTVGAENEAGMASLQGMRLSSPVKQSLTYPDELQLASYKYAALEERHRKLADQHSDLLKLCSTYNEVIYGHCSHDDDKQFPSIGELRAEAGDEGLRGKALEADILRPRIREAGGLQALVTQLQSVRSLIDQAGSLTELEELVYDTHLLQISVDEVGGLQGLHHLISEAESLRLKHQEGVKLRGMLDGPNGLISKAAKYDMLMQAVTDIQNAPVSLAATHPVSAMRMTSTPLRDKSPIAPLALVTTVALGTINPARASRIGSAAPQDDPDRDLYEPPPPVQPRNKTGSNREPLGPPLTGRSTTDHPGHGWLKREPSEDLGAQASVTKRPRLDTNKQWQTCFDQLAHTPWNQLRNQTKNGPGSTSQDIIVARYPIALWTGTADPTVFPWSPTQLMPVERIPEALGKFLAVELTKYINDTNVHLWNAMAPNTNTCVLRYLLDGHRPSGQPQERRACRICTSAWVNKPRPCALLQEVADLRMLVVLPLREGMVGSKKNWQNSGHYMLADGK
jgi:hypothetical protein